MTLKNHYLLISFGILALIGGFAPLFAGLSLSGLARNLLFTRGKVRQLGHSHSVKDPDR